MRVITVVLLSLSTLPALAQDGMYVGLGLGRLDYEEGGFSPAFGNTLADTVLSYKVYGGFEFNQYVAAEISYGKADEVAGGASGNDPDVGNFETSIRTEFTTTVIKVVGQLPLEWGVLIGGIGYFETNADVRIDLTTDLGSFSGSGSASDDGLAAMFGIEWRFGRFGTGYGVRLEYEWWDLQNADASTIGVGMSYRF
jgi:hypothetical protein